MSNEKENLQAGQEVKKGLILEGGAMRGMFTCGVVDVLMENEIHFDGAAGISAGAVFGCNYKSGQIGRAIRYNKNYCRDPRYCSFRSLIMTGDLYGADFCYRELPEVLDPFDTETFEKNPVEFYVGATNVENGKCIFHKCSDGKGKDVQWMQASASMPLASRPVAIDGYLLLDGGISDSVPFKFMESKGYNRNLIILTQPDGFVKKKSGVIPLLKLTSRKYPAIIKAMARRHEMYNRQMDEIKEREEKGISFVIRPPEALGISRTERNPEELERVYQMGRREAERRLPELRRFMSV